MSSPSLLFDQYRTAEDDQPILIFDHNYNSQVIVIQPLFEERNFLRSTIVSAVRTLAQHGIGSSIPDLPGTGDSPSSDENNRLSSWREAMVDLVAQTKARTGRTPHIAAFRGGALVDDVPAASHWRFAPVTGLELLKPLRRAAQLSRSVDPQNLGGYTLTPAMIAELESAAPCAQSGPFRELPAGGSGTPVWRRSEPDRDQSLVDLISDDLIRWIQACDAS